MVERPRARRAACRRPGDPPDRPGSPTSRRRRATEPPASASGTWPGIGRGPTARGFDTYFDGDAPNFPPCAFIEADQPFFLYLPLTAPHRPIAPRRGMKSGTWEGCHRVPVLVRLTDLFATLTGIAGCEVPAGAGEDSRDFADVLRGDAASAREVIVHHSGNGTFAIRETSWKLVLDNLGSGGFTQPSRVAPKEGQPAGQLYDLSKDLGEEVDLYAARPERVQRLRQLLAEIRGEG